jgi:adenylosuccinate lyase
MAQKRNPRGVDHWKGFAKILRGNALAMLEVAMEHERDATRLPAEQSAMPQSCTNLAAVLADAKVVLGGLQVFPENMRKNMMSAGGYILSEAVIYLLARKTGKKQDAHDLMYRVTQKGISEGKTLREALLGSHEITQILTAAEIERALDPEFHIGEAATAVEDMVQRLRAKRTEGTPSES